jgi:5-methylcytosine-specific restriction endonuclease McrA
VSEVSLSLFYRNGRLPIEKFYFGGMRVVEVRPLGLLEPWIIDGEYHCLVCGEVWHDRRRKYFCSDECRDLFSKQWHVDYWSWYRERVWNRDNGKCCHCGREVKSSSDFVCDHIVPLFKGGKDWFEDGKMQNFQTLCLECNGKKTGMDFLVPKKAKEKARLVSLGFIFEIPKDQKLETFFRSIVPAKVSVVREKEATK